VKVGLADSTIVNEGVQLAVSGVTVRLAVIVAVRVGLGVRLRVAVAVREGVRVRVRVQVAVDEDVSVLVNVEVGVKVEVKVGVKVSVGVGVWVSVKVAVGVYVAVGEAVAVHRKLQTGGRFPGKVQAARKRARITNAKILLKDIDFSHIIRPHHTVRDLLID
jgi:hypothetical protein